MTSRKDTVSAKARFRKAAAVLLVGGVAAFSIGCVLYFLGVGRESILSQKGSDWSDFGQFIGGFSGSLISLCALAAVAYNLVLQAEELEETQKQMRAQAAAMAQQAFDSVFFQLLTRFSAVRDSVSYKSVSRRASLDDPSTITIDTGLEAFRCIYSDLAKEFQRGPGDLDRLTYLQRGFEALYEAHESLLGPYFRTLYHVFKFIDRNSSLTEEQKADYANMARAQLSNIELCVLFYDGLTTLAAEFMPLIVRYGILKHVNPETLLDPQDRIDLSLYRPEAFLSTDERRKLTGIKVAP